MRSGRALGRLAHWAALAVVLVPAAMLALRGSRSALTYDEGTYLVSVLDLQHGQELGTDVFAPQPPLFYGAVRLATWVFGPDVADVRKGIVIMLLAGMLGAYLLVRALVGPWAGVAAAALVVVAPPVPLDAARVYADLPALALTLLALGLAAQRPERRGAQVLLACTAGAVLAVAVGVKLTALIGLPPLVLLLAMRPRPAGRLAAAAAGALVTAAFVALAYRNAIGALWTSLVDYRRAARATANLVGPREVLGVVLDLHAAFTVALLAGVALAGVRLVREQSLREVASIAPVVVLAVLSWAALLAYRPLHLNHLVLVSVALAVSAAALAGWGAAALGPSAQRLAGAGMAVLALLAFSQGWRRAGNELPRESPDVVRLASRVAEVTPADAFVVTDKPGVAYLARRQVPGALVDTARLRFETGSLTDVTVLETIDRSCVAAVVAGRSFLLRPQLLAGIRERFEHVERSPAGLLFLGRRAPCDTGAA